jgi:hypothetical protein
MKVLSGESEEGFAEEGAWRQGRFKSFWPNKRQEAGWRQVITGRKTSTGKSLKSSVANFSW